MKKYALLKKLNNGTIAAMIDLPMSMGWSTKRVHLWNYPPKHYWKKGYFIVRKGSKNCPIKIENNNKCNQKFIQKNA